MENKPNFRLDGNPCLMEWVRQFDFMATSYNGWSENYLVGGITVFFLPQFCA
jgi:hypothetical protein